jgi:hypothetical protein
MQSSRPWKHRRATAPLDEHGIHAVVSQEKGSAQSDDAATGDEHVRRFLG